MRIAYRSFPFRNRGVPEQTRVWRPVLPVQIISGKHATSKRFEAVVDTGSDYCLFNAMIGAAIGIKIDSGSEGDLGGVIAGPRSKVYFHTVKLVVASEIVDIKAGFCWDLSENLLRQSGSLTTLSYASMLRRIHRVLRSRESGEIRHAWSV